MINDSSTKKLWFAIFKFITKLCRVLYYHLKETSYEGHSTLIRIFYIVIYAQKKPPATKHFSMLYVCFDIYWKLIGKVNGGFELVVT